MLPSLSIMAFVDEEEKICAGLPMMKLGAFFTGQALGIPPSSPIHCFPLYSDDNALRQLAGELYVYIN